MRPPLTAVAPEEVDAPASAEFVVAGTSNVEDLMWSTLTSVQD